MLRVVILATIATGCGRIGFDPAGGDAVATCAPAAATIRAGDTADGVLCVGNIDVYTVTLAAGDEVRATLASDAPGYLTLEIRGRAVETLDRTTSAFADHDGTYEIAVGGLAARAGTPYQLGVALDAGRHFFASPTGNDANPGTFAQPWRDVDTTVDRLVAGDALVLEDGLYFGDVGIDCGTGAASGTQAQPIRLVALSERKAHFLSDGAFTTLELRNGCAWWRIEGLFLESADKQGGASGGALTVAGSKDIVVRRVLAQHNNRDTNSAPIVVDSSTNVLVEECEVYDFHRGGLLLVNGSGYTARRNVVASRGRADIAGGFASDPTDKGDSGLSTYSATAPLLENNVDEGNGAMALDNGFGDDLFSAHLIGNISLHDDFGVIASVFDGTTARNAATGLLDHAAIGSTNEGYYMRSTQQSSCTRCTAIGGAGGGWHADELPTQPGVMASSSCTSCLAVGNGGRGFSIDVQRGGWMLTSPDAFGNGTSFQPASDPRLVAPTELDPRLGGCLVYHPADSALPDIGAEIVFRAEDNAITRVPLWHPITGAFPCGAVVAGVNDDPATSCIGLQQRLHVGTADCALPYAAP